MLTKDGTIALRTGCISKQLIQEKRFFIKLIQKCKLSGDVGLGFFTKKVAKEGKSCPSLLVLQRVAQNANSCSKVAEHNLFMPNDYPSVGFYT